MSKSLELQRGDILGRRFRIEVKSEAAALWVSYHGVDLSSSAAIAQKPREQPDVRIKLVRPALLPDAAARDALREALLRTRPLDHPGLPHLIDVLILEDHATVAIIEPIFVGVSAPISLHRTLPLRVENGLPFSELRQVGARIAAVLAYVHGRGLCHGDLRPETVATRAPAVEISDVMLGATLPRRPYLEAVQACGEAQFLAPEVRAEAPPDWRADIFGLAALYRQMFSLCQPSSDDVEGPDRAAIDRVLDRGMAEDPAARHASIADFIADLQTALPPRRSPRTHPEPDRVLRDEYPELFVMQAAPPEPVKIPEEEEPSLLAYGTPAGGVKILRAGIAKLLPLQPQPRRSEPIAEESIGQAMRLIGGVLFMALVVTGVLLIIQSRSTTPDGGPLQDLGRLDVGQAAVPDMHSDGGQGRPPH